jgi:hypothetical protein
VALGSFAFIFEMLVFGISLACRAEALAKAEAWMLDAWSFDGAPTA